MEEKGGRLDTGALRSAISEAGRVDAVGHRVVHGGPRFSGPVRLDAKRLKELRELTALAPLHQPPALAAIAAVAAALPRAPAVACFDTAFHHRLPSAAATYALPREWRDRFAIRRYGFHGLSHAYASRRAAEMLGRPVAGFRVVTCHLGSGASLSAVRSGRSVDTTMGFTPLEGLVMSTRSGSVDPGLLIWLQRHARLGLTGLEDRLERGSGLLGLAGSGDMREVLARAARGDADARLALDVYLHRLRAGIAAMVAALGGLDALVFTGGVGENAATIRLQAAQGLSYLGVKVDARANRAAAPDREIGARGAAVRTLVVHAREDLEIARQVRRLLRSGGARD